MASEGTWSKGAAVRGALRRAEPGAVVLADADVWCDGVESAVRAVTCGAAEWAMPHRTVWRLSREQTDSYLELDGELGLNGEYDREPYEGIWGGGIVVAHRDLLLDVPIDPRFAGWGGEDESWAMALECLAGPGWRGSADLIHLYHPPQERLWEGRWGSIENRILRRRYGRAGANPDAMRELIGEANAILTHTYQ